MAINTVHEKKTLAIRIALTVIAVAAITTLAVLSFKTHDGYTAMRDELRGLSASMATLRTQNEKLQAESDDLEKKLSFRQDENTEAAITYSITTGNHIRQPSNPYQDVGTDTLFLDLKVKNNSGQQGFISPSEVKLKDDQDHTFAAFGSYPTPYPGGLQKLDAQTIRPNETITGALVFTVPTGVDTFTLVYGTLEITVKAQ